MPFKIKRAGLSSLSSQAAQEHLQGGEDGDTDAIQCSGWDAKHPHDFIMAGLTGYHH